MRIIFLILALFSSLLCENRDTTLSKIRDRAALIENASKIYNIDKAILSSIIYVERTENYNWEDKALDNILAKRGLNSSIGFCQVKMKTAYWIEVQLNDTSKIYFPGEKYEHSLELSNSPDEIIEKLNNDSLNLMYAAAYLRIIINRWQSKGIDIENNAGILGTLYSTGLFKRNGKEREPNKDPKANEFGEKVERLLNLFK